MATKAEKAPKQEKPKVKLTISQVKKDLADGVDRDGIAEKYGLTKGDVKKLFQHPLLKGLKVKTAPGFDLVDDTVEEEEENAEVDQTASTNATAPEEKTGDKAQEGKPVEEAATSKKGVW